MGRKHSRTNKENSLRIIISGGGTGGHIFPAVAIARELKARDAKTDILFVGAHGRMEMEKVPMAGFPIVGLPIRGLQRSLSMKNLAVPLRLAAALFKAVQVVRRYKPDVAVGVGGYASGPTLMACRLLGVPYLIQEQNSYAGVTNRLLAGGAKKICVAFAGMEQYFPAEKLTLTGNPVRPGFENVNSLRVQALAHFGLNPEKPVLLVTGGSLGARTLNLAMASHLEALLQAQIQVIWQTGKNFQKEISALVANLNTQGAVIQPFIDNMALAYAAADVVVARAGALTISELCMAGRAAILVPSPNVAEDHQTKNALALVENQAAVMVADAQAAKTLLPQAIELLSDKARQRQLSERISNLAKPNATAHLADMVLGLVQNQLPAPKTGAE